MIYKRKNPPQLFQLSTAVFYCRLVWHCIYAIVFIGLIAQIRAIAVSIALIKFYFKLIDEKYPPALQLSTNIQKNSAYQFTIY